MGNKLEHPAGHTSDITRSTEAGPQNTLDPNERVNELFYVGQQMAVRNGVPMTATLHETGIKISPRGGENVANRPPPLPHKTGPNGNGNGTHRPVETNSALTEKRRRRQENMNLVEGLYKGNMYRKGRRR
ncbi:MAG: hypothetical protein HYU48_02550 [Candidatus Levybacteria bacterium]|nr:hypothetical protein [Candidatus Levybacteria bacterium]